MRQGLLEHCNMKVVEFEVRLCRGQVGLQVLQRCATCAPVPFIRPVQYLNGDHPWHFMEL